MSDKCGASDVEVKSGIAHPDPCTLPRVMLHPSASQTDLLLLPSIAILVENAYLNIFSPPFTTELGQALPSSGSIYL